MKKIAKAVLATSILGLVMLAPGAVNAAGEEVGITISTDKSSYDTTDDINAEITIENASGNEIDNLNLSGKVPEGYSQEGAKDFVWTLGGQDTLKDGETKTYQLSFKSEKVKANTNTATVKEADIKDIKNDTSVKKDNKTAQTGDTAYLSLALIMLILSGTGMILVFKKKDKRILSILLAGGLAGAMALSATRPVRAAEPDDVSEVKASAEIKVGDETITLEVVVSYKNVKSSNADNTADQKTELSYEGYNLKWEDNFDSALLDRTYWNVELHEKAWVNGEDQEYVDSEDNIFIRDGKLVLQAHEDASGRITSGRVNTQGKVDFKYGLIEVSAKVPEGQGFLPAFWLMPTNENLYGQWPRCGEIDAMEIKGQDTDTVLGTIHYGNPHMQSQGSKVTEQESFSECYHKFAVEWEPGKITWYVDGVKYHEESDWFTSTEGAGTASYPAPFDQNFYVILNLAVGNDWAGEVGEGVVVDGAEFDIDYVKVYQKDSYDEDVKKPEKTSGALREPDETGNYLNNGDFAVVEDLTDEKDWKFMTQEGGEATAEIKNKKINISPVKDGNVDYSIQLVQAGIPLEKGASYRVTFDGKAVEDRNIKVAVKAPDRGWAEYMPAKTVALTKENNSYSYEFKMTQDTDPNARFEYEIGKAGSVAAFSLSNIRLEKIAEPDEEELNKKTVLSTGNYVYNGGFDQGEKRLGYWEFSDADKALVKVTTEGNDGTIHRLELAENVTVKESELGISSGQTYRLSFDAEAKEEGAGIEVVLAGERYQLDLTTENKTYEFIVNVSENAANKDISIKNTSSVKVYLDNVSVTEAAMIKNGSFNAGSSGWEAYIDSNADATFVIDSLSEDNAADFTINGTGGDDWRIQLKQTGVNLEKGKWYKFSFKVKSSLPRQMRAILQGDEAHGWAAYSGENIVDLTSEYQTFEKVFCMANNTDKGAFVSFCLGKVGDNEINIQHRVCIDDVSLVEIDKPEDMETPELEADPVETKTGNNENGNNEEKKNTEVVSPGTNMISNADFSDGLTGWTNVITEQGQATTATADAKVTYHIENTGDKDYSIQLKKEGISLTKGKTYTMKLKMSTSVDRNVKIGIMSADYSSWYAGGEPVLSVGEDNELTYTFTMSKDDPTAQIYISMGKTLDTTPLTADITISDISLVEEE